jgi:hypothetical protein
VGDTPEKQESWHGNDGEKELVPTVIDQRAEVYGMVERKKFVP